MTMRIIVIKFYDIIGVVTVITGVIAIVIIKILMLKHNCNDHNSNSQHVCIGLLHARKLQSTEGRTLQHVIEQSFYTLVCGMTRVRVRIRPESPKAARLGLRQGPYLQVCTKISSGYVTRIKIAWQSAWHDRTMA